MTKQKKSKIVGQAHQGRTDAEPVASASCLAASPAISGLFPAQAKVTNRSALKAAPPRIRIHFVFSFIPVSLPFTRFLKQYFDVGVMMHSASEILTRQGACQCGNQGLFCVDGVWHME